MHPMIKAIICDLDGTLALLSGRDPFNPKTIANDEPNSAIVNILKVYTHQTLFEVKIFFITGRFEKYRKQTDAWLRKHAIPDYILFMRRNADFRKDTVYKKELYQKHIKNKFDVLFVLEDRDQAVKMWRELGLTCLHYVTKL
jgi:hypothetical protein